MITTKIQVIESPIGKLVANWTKMGIYSFSFEQSAPKNYLQSDTAVFEPKGGDRNSNTGFSPKLARELEKTVARYFKTGGFDWDLNTLDWTDVPPFHHLVLQACAKIDKGETMTYGELARRCGSPHAARAVGQAMAKNRWPLIIPCHRVVGSSGKLTGYSGAGGIATKAQLLSFECGGILDQHPQTRSQSSSSKGGTSPRSTSPRNRPM